MRACEARLETTLPREMREFYRFADGARLFDKTDPPYRIMSLAELCHPSIVIPGADHSQNHTSGLIAFCDVRDGNYVAASMRDCAGDECPMVDCFHETFPDADYMETISMSFSEFLSRTLASGGELFWL